MEQQIDTHGRSRWLREIAVAIPICIAVASLIGWVAGIPLLFEPMPGLATMKVNTAVAVILCAIALRLLSEQAGAVRRTGALLTALALGITGATLAERVFELDLGIDQFLLRDWRSARRLTPPGRMSIAAALGLVFVSLGLLTSLRFRRTSQMLSIGAMLIGYISLVGYLYDVEALFRVAPFGAISAQTAACLLVLGVGLLSLHADEGLMAPITLPGPGRELASRLLPVVVLLPPAVGYLRLEGERAGYYDTSFGLALMVVVIVVGATALIVVSSAALNRSSRAHQTALQAEGELRDGIIASALFGIVVIDADGFIRLANPRYCEITGYAPDELVGQHFDIVIPEANRVAARASFRRNLASHETIQDVEFEVRRRDGSVISVIYGLAPLPGRGGIVANLVDISDRKRLEEQLRQAQKLEGIGQLAGGVAHDFNNILTAIFGDAAFLQSAAAPESPLRHHADQIVRHAERAADLTRQLLSFARKQMIVPSVVNLADTVRLLEPMLRRLIPENIELVVRALPDGATVLADAGQVEQVVLNLVVNARDAMPYGGRIVIETGRTLLDSAAGAVHGELAPGEYAVLAVADNGTGMDARTRERIFEPFFTTKELGRGTGLGLSTVYGIVRQFGGSILVYSEPGVGSTFKVYLPFKATGPKSGPSATPRPAAPRGSATILLAEDQREVRDIIAASLRGLGYSVLTAETGEQGLDIAEKASKPIDLLISDALMPGMSGRELGNRLRARWPGLRILLISGYTEEVAGQLGVRSADVDFLPKPFATTRLAEKVAEILSRATEGPARSN